ncbi:hypothetical protein BGZ65_004658 [Modicella reniformis]|uniref:Uncharacterized protein n=1 Tax=Modicella reniformis TaxID=1440133 RepID=A0A9P6MGX7_9FUNG|nr:hypothetical protein BGZ65_004658 [Modicella reniformis]
MGSREMEVVTSSYRKDFELKSMNNQALFSLFDMIICEPAIKQGKPNPDIFFVAKDRLAE